MRVFKMTYKNQLGKSKQSRKWAIEFRDHKEIIRRLSGFTDKAQTQELGRKVEKLVAATANNEQPEPGLRGWFETMPPKIRTKLDSLELLDARHVAAGKPLDEHVQDFKKSVEAKGNTQKHVKLLTGRLQRIVDDCGFRFWSDISGNKVETYLHERRQRDSKFGAQSYNFYLQAIKQFCHWMVQERRASESPLTHMRGLNVRTDRRHDRRALSVEEMQCLLQAAHRGPERKGKTWSMAGPDRAMLYRLAMETGLRSSELRSLTKSSLDLSGEPGTVTVRAAYSKRRREDILPLRQQMVGLLKPFLAPLEAGDTVFKMPRQEKVAESLLRPDLESAREKWLSEAADSQDRRRRGASDFLRYVDHVGRFADFHSLRHSFITNIGRVGVSFKTTQDLARHSTPTLTARYSHSFKHDEVAAINSLPDLTSVNCAPIGIEERKTQLKNSALYSASKSAEEDYSAQSSAVGDTPGSVHHPVRKFRIGNALDSLTEGCEDKPNGGEMPELAERGGFENRCVLTGTGGSNPSLSAIIICGVGG